MTQSRTVEVDGLAIHVREDGQPDSPALVLLHSIGTSGAVWDPIVAALSPRYRVIRPDMRGHGQSKVGPGGIGRFAQDVLAVLDALQVGEAFVAGLSIGGLIAQEVALQARERVRALVLIDTGMVFPPATLWTERAAQVRAQGMQAVRDSVTSRWVTGAASRQAIEWLEGLLLATPPEGYAAAAESLATADLSERARQIAVPTLVLVGEADPSTTVATAEAIRDTIKGAQLEVIGGASHIPQAEQPAAVAGALLRFLAPDPFERGMRTRRAVLGDAHVDRSMQRASAFDRDFQRWITAQAWGSVWSRPHFDRRTRSIVTLAILAALGREEEFKLHLRATRNTGASAEDIAEMLLHVGVYAGVPAANSAMRMAREILAEGG